MQVRIALTTASAKPHPTRHLNTYSHCHRPEAQVPAQYVVVWQTCARAADDAAHAPAASRSSAGLVCWAAAAEHTRGGLRLALQERTKHTAHVPADDQSGGGAGSCSTRGARNEYRARHAAVQGSVLG